MWLPKDWSAERASGWWELHHLIHESCGFRSTNAYDLVLDVDPFGRRMARELVFTHECEEN